MHYSMSKPFIPHMRCSSNMYCIISLEWSTEKETLIEHLILCDVTFMLLITLIFCDVTFIFCDVTFMLLITLITLIYKQKQKWRKDAIDGITMLHSATTFIQPLQIGWSVWGFLFPFPSPPPFLCQGWTNVVWIRGSAVSVYVQSYMSNDTPSVEILLRRHCI